MYFLSFLKVHSLLDKTYSRVLLKLSICMTKEVLYTYLAGICAPNPIPTWIEKYLRIKCLADHQNFEACQCVHVWNVHNLTQFYLYWLGANMVWYQRTSYARITKYNYLSYVHHTNRRIIIWIMDSQINMRSLSGTHDAEAHTMFFNMTYLVLV